MRLKLKVFLLAVIPLLASAALIAWAVGQQEKSLSQRERALVESAYMANKEAELRHYVDLAQSVIAPLYQSGRDDEATKAEAMRLLAALDYGADGYFFLYDMSGRNLMHPRQPELMGRNLWEMRDAQGQPIIQQLIGKAREGGGYVQYVWQKPSTQQITPKLGYVVSLPRWNWMLGTGLYLDDIHATLAELDQQVSDNVRTTMWWIAGIALAGIAVLGACGLAFNLSESREADHKLRLLARQVVKSQEDERAHLSRELHDGTSQTLVSIKLLLESAQAQLDRDGSAPLAKALARLNDALHEVRNISHRLRPAELDVLGLPAALEQMGREFSEHSEMAFDMRVGGAASPLPDAVSTVLFRVTQEALTNIEKHAEAGEVQVRLVFGVTGVRLRITDDGVGFDAQAVALDPRRGIGLRNMRERVESIGGRFQMRSRPGRTEVVVDVPAASLRRLSPSERLAA
ncbi:cache domain-containing protein [Piscinibacter gummiphilus]|uniref:Cache domain-containing protein n=1 Tax=Piscinibacter gummiphilus TaxID=946333 RepID=A0ABZ0CZJ8_9BURK|nr:cache domain-containing protein [Piscinibacter gummiphilus]WOB10367.1 cache domain-containing protein [Piscinibacter gummiphilus]